MKHFDNPSDQAAFDRWVDITAELLQKYGPAFLAQKAKTEENHVLSSSDTATEQSKPLESLSEVA